MLIQGRGMVYPTLKLFRVSDIAGQLPPDPERIGVSEAQRAVRSLLNRWEHLEFELI